MVFNKLENRNMGRYEFITSFIVKIEVPLFYKPHVNLLIFIIFLFLDTSLRWHDIEPILAGHFCIKKCRDHSEPMLA